MQPWYKRLDWPVLVAWAALVGVGLVAIYSTTHGPAREFLLTSVQQNFNRQFRWFGVCVALLVFVLLIPARVLIRLSPLAYVGGVGLLLAALLFGTEINGARAWIFGVQPGELAKPVTVLAVTALLSREEARRGSVPYLFGAAVLIIVPSALLVLANDTGTALVYLSLLPVMLFWSGAMELDWMALLVAPAVAVYFVIVNPWMAAGFTVITTVAMLYATRSQMKAMLAFASTGVVSALAYVGLFRVLQPHQVARLVAFDNPEAFRQTAGFHVIQSKAAIGSGGLFGKGFTQGTQTQLAYIPEQSTDFVFTIIGEEFGFLGAAVVLGLFAFLLIRLAALGVQAAFSVPRLYMAGVTGIFLVHVLINIGMTVGVMPVIGIPLPFVSYGGSALLANTGLLAIAMNLHARRDEFGVYTSQ